MTEHNQQPTHAGSYTPQFPASHHQSDEIDLMDLFIALWKGKVTIIISTVLFSVVAVVYALTAQQWWSSKAKVTEPQLQNMAAYTRQINKFQSVLANNKDLAMLAKSETLFKYFLQNFNSSDNKRLFLDTSPEFNLYKNGLGLPESQNDEESKSELRSLYAEWFGKIVSSAEDRKDTSSPFDLTLQATTQNSSLVMLREYVEFIENKTREDLFGNFQVVVDAEIELLENQKQALEVQARNRLAVETQRAQYALDIAKAANVNKPIQSYNDKEIFSIDMGFQALEAKVKALASIKDLSVIEPRLQLVSANLERLSKIKIDLDIEFDTVRFLEEAEPSISRDKPKRALIAVLGTLLGGMLGVAIVLIRFASRNKED